MRDARVALYASYVGSVPFHQTSCAVQGTMKADAAMAVRVVMTERNAMSAML